MRVIGLGYPSNMTTGQQRKRQGAPGDLELVREFVNTRNLEAGTEGLRAPADLQAWLSARDIWTAGSPADETDLANAVELREALRAVLISHTGHAPHRPAAEALTSACRRAQITPLFDEQGKAILKAEAGGTAGALGELLIRILTAQTGGTWERLKACPAENCRWAFYDSSRNRKGVWCQMYACGNRAKARSYRERHGNT